MPVPVPVPVPPASGTGIGRTGAGAGPCAGPCAGPVPAPVPVHRYAGLLRAEVGRTISSLSRFLFFRGLFLSRVDAFWLVALRWRCAKKPYL